MVLSAGDAMLFFLPLTAGVGGGGGKVTSFSDLALTTGGGGVFPPETGEVLGAINSLEGFIKIKCFW
ncbi:unnamed protein product [Arabidopsis halleri]